MNKITPEIMAITMQVMSDCPCEIGQNLDDLYDWCCGGEGRHIYFEDWDGKALFEFITDAARAVLDYQEKATRN